MKGAIAQRKFDSIRDPTKPPSRGESGDLLARMVTTFDWIFLWRGFEDQTAAGQEQLSATAFEF